MNVKRTHLAAVVTCICLSAFIWFFLPFDRYYESGGKLTFESSAKYILHVDGEKRNISGTVARNTEPTTLFKVKTHTEVLPKVEMVQEHSVRPNIDISSITFRIHHAEQIKATESAICSKCSDLDCNSKCSKFKDILKQLSVNQTTEEGPVKLHLVLLDPLVWKQELDENHTDFNNSLEEFARSFDSASRYVKFKGSDHIFICLSENCSKFASLFSERLSNNKGTRAIMTGINMNWEQIKWPCPLRVIKLTEKEATSPTDLLAKLLQSGQQLVSKGSRWICADETHQVNYWDKVEDGRFVGGHYLEEFNFLLCTFPKGGSTTLKMLMKRLMHVQNWNVSSHIHSPSKNHLVTVNTNKSPEITKKVFEDPSFVKAAVVRNPFSRVISGYLDKIVHSHHYAAIPGLKPLVRRQKHPPSFAQYVELLTRPNRDPSLGDKHFRSQTSFCGLNSTKFDFVGDLDHMHEDFIEFAESVGIWQDYGASGWGEDGTKPMIDAWIYKQAPHHSTEKIWKYFDEELLMKVYNHYKEDFDLLGYSIDDIFASKPTT